MQILRGEAAFIIECMYSADPDHIGRAGLALTLLYMTDPGRRWWRAWRVCGRQTVSPAISIWSAPRRGGGDYLALGGVGGVGSEVCGFRPQC
jgi:hypothetical protein